MTRLDELSREGVVALYACLLEDYRRTGDKWYLLESEKVAEYMRVDNDAQLRS